MGATATRMAEVLRSFPTERAFAFRRAAGPRSTPILCWPRLTGAFVTEASQLRDWGAPCTFNEKLPSNMIPRLLSFFFACKYSYEAFGEGLHTAGLTAAQPNSPSSRAKNSATRAQQEISGGRSIQPYGNTTSSPLPMTLNAEVVRY